MKAKSIKGYPVVNLDDGSIAGKVQDLIIDPHSKKIEGLAISEKAFLKGKSTVIPYEQVYKIGRDVITVKSLESREVDKDRLTGLENFKEYSFLGNSIISTEGNYIAKVQDFIFSPTTGQIESLILSDIRNRKNIHKGFTLPIDSVLKLGKDYVIADENFVSLIKGEEEEEEEDDIAEKAKEETTPPGSELLEEAKKRWFQLEKEIFRGGKELAAESRERMKHYLRGKKVSSAVKDDEGNILVHPLEELTEEIIEIVESRNKLTQLFLNVISEEVEDSLNVMVKRIREIFR